MKDFFKTMDLYKAIVLASVVLLPAGYWWISLEQDNIAKCQQAVKQATKRGGFLEDIGAYQKKIEVIANNRQSSSSIDSPSMWFEGQITDANLNLATNDFSPKPPKEETVTLGPRQKATDYVVDIEWPNKDLRVKMDFVYAVLFNCESGASSNQTLKGRPSVWRLRDLHLVNATNERLMRSGRVPPPELKDEWIIKDMKFARREPKRSRR